LAANLFQVLPKRILLVDDSPVILERLMFMLEDQKAYAALCSCGTFFEARQLIGRLAPDVLVLDINLPDGSGIELLELMKKQRPETAVIMLSNRSEAYYRRLCKTLGADYFLNKSKEFEEVPYIIRTLIRAL
jgi:DNA-binding NarL/FixJ family response regulator